MQRVLAIELAVLTTLAAGLAAAVSFRTGYLGWSWDALNHHVYLGMIAEHPRWDLDVIPASFQSYQYPYLYWPIYRLSLWNGSGAGVAAVWSGFQAAMLLPPVWLVSLRLLPATAGHWQSLAERLAACGLAAMSIVVWASLQSTANDLLAAVPLLWAAAVALSPSESGRSLNGAGLLFGMSVAFKLSNALFVPMMLLWWWQPRRPFLPLGRGARLLLGSAAGFLIAYAPWGWQLWKVAGNPFYPFLGR
jgi:hypothetical protein